MRKTILICFFLLGIAREAIAVRNCAPVPTTRLIALPNNVSAALPLSPSRPEVLGPVVFWPSRYGLVGTDFYGRIRFMVKFENKFQMTTPLVPARNKICFGTDTGALKCYDNQGNETSTSQIGTRVFDLGQFGSDFIANVEQNNKSVFIKTSEFGGQQKVLAEGLTLQTSPGILAVGSSSVLVTKSEIIFVNSKLEIKKYSNSDDSFVQTIRRNAGEALILSAKGTLQGFASTGPSKKLELKTSNVKLVDVLGGQTKFIVVKSNLGLDVYDLNAEKLIARLPLSEIHQGLSAISGSLIYLSSPDQQVHIFNTNISKVVDTIDLGKAYDHVLSTGKEVIAVTGSNALLFDLNKTKLDQAGFMLPMNYPPLRVGSNAWVINAGGSIVASLSVQVKNQFPPGCAPKAALKTESKPQTAGFRVQRQPFTLPPGFDRPRIDHPLKATPVPSPFGKRTPQAVPQLKKPAKKKLAPSPISSPASGLKTQRKFRP